MTALRRGRNDQPHSPHPLQRASIVTTLAVIAAAAFAVLRPDGFDRVGAGVFGGALLGGSIGLLAHGLVGMAMRVDTEAAFRSLAIGFFAKAAGAILPWAALTFLPQAAPLAHPTAYLLAYAGTLLLVLGAGVLDHLRVSHEVATESSAGTPVDSIAGPDSAVSPQPIGSSRSLESAS